MNSSAYSVSFFFVILLVRLISISSSPYNDQDQDQNKKSPLDHGGISVGDIRLDKFPTSEVLQSNEWPSSSYYHQRCSNKNVEGIIHNKVKEWVDKDYKIAPSLLRLQYHDCAVRGCDASILLNHEGSERKANVSKTLRGFEVIDDIKAELERECPKTVSCADILAASARDATVQLGGQYWTVPFGRKDGRVSIAKEAEIVPMGHDNVTTLVEFIQSLGLEVSDLVILLGAHTFGRISCAQVQDRIYNYKGTGKADPSINKNYLNFLERRCRWASEDAELDAETPWKFDNMYYKNLQNGMGLLPTDQILLSDKRTEPIAKALASMPSSLYGQIFGASMTKFGKVNVLFGDEGEIRTNCNFVNSNSY